MGASWRGSARPLPGLGGRRSAGGPSRGRCGFRRSSASPALPAWPHSSCWERCPSSRGRRRQPVSEIGIAPVEPGIEMVQFVLVAPQASTVAVVGDFNDWDPSRTPLRAEAAGGVWSVNVPLRSGAHQYAFVVDGKDWRPDPAAPRAVTDDFGAPNSVIFVGGK